MQTKMSWTKDLELGSLVRFGKGKYLHIANMWILTPKNIYNQGMWGIHISNMRENIQNMWIEYLIYT